MIFLNIKVNGELYPVAYLIVEDNTGANTVSSMTGSTSTATNNNIFLSPSKTMFVMEGQKTQISCQMKESHLNIAWYRDQEIIQESHRIHFNSTNDGWYHVIINETDTSDQGTYYAYYEDSSTYITLVVEDQNCKKWHQKIDEKEVVVSGPETDDEDLNDYLVPPGSTATIACELESSEFLRDLVWQRNNKDLQMNDKLEHVVNGNKHYLIIHNAQPDDSGVYSVRINDTQFKVAQITITEGTQILSGSRLKRISNNSLQSFRS
uniref:Ig-like domain-containing protein n=1 Tax=Panagrolaimus davidi TaxID=227884 RepID=A0A914P9Z5_9BILA